ncbi:Nitrogen permease regulator 3 [Neophaeococcomyces mojaviensis]|uniref:Nitrogen permease regulator 3 n=1 Tax=Neophaeococcomyces mojaviensis TaxID=3383035 RepID=A0ACC3AA85_9EURO|nr:Nitrogen permease regulator 3 [Knufia sp. JES_112]
MSSTISVPDPCLLAILLVCQTREGSGPELVYHWPPDPLTYSNPSKRSDWDATTDDYDSSSDSEDYSSDNDDDDFGPVSRNKLDVSVHGPGSKLGRIASTKSDHEDSKTKDSTLLGLDEDGLVALLAPDRSWHKRKFELSINDLTFVGRPVFAKHDGLWRKRKRAKAAKPPAETSDVDTTTEDEDGTQQTPNQDQSSKSQLMMFHVVFVMNPPPLDHSYRVKEMYDNVIKKFSRALQWVQVHNEYVWKQAESLHSRRRQLLAASTHSRKAVMKDLLESSSLAKALMSVFNAISTSRIASVSLGQNVSMSLQIPPVTSTSYLPSLTEPPIPPGLWLTTATETPSSSEDLKKQTSSSTLELAKSYTLLLKSPPHRIAKDVQVAGGPLASHLPKFVAALRPTKSFFKLTNTAQMSLPDVQLLARHLIYWRRAIAIPPLHQRDTYIVSPNADFRKLREACRSYEAQFPSSLPSLPRLLNLLSGIPRPFMTLIPSHDHKDIYMLVLAWLMRNGWVTQLRTFAYVRIDTEVKQRSKEKEREMRASIAQDAKIDGANDIKKDDASSNEPNGTERPSFVSRQSSDGRQSLKNGRMINDKGATLIMSPPKASPEESRWLNYLHNSTLRDDDHHFSSLSNEEREEIHRYWPNLTKYFDGSTALESVPIKENLKRKLVWSLYGKLGLDFDRGVEDSKGMNNSIIVTIRHW